MKTDFEQEVLQGIIVALEDLIENDDYIYINDEDNITYTFELENNYYIVVTNSYNKTKLFKLSIEEHVLKPAQ
jgi:hypothetical protein